MACLLCSVDPFTLKEWYDIKAPSIFQVRTPGKTLVTRTKGTSKYRYGVSQFHFVCVQNSYVALTNCLRGCIGIYGNLDYLLVLSFLLPPVLGPYSQVSLEGECM